MFTVEMTRRSFHNERHRPARRKASYLSFTYIGNGAHPSFLDLRKVPSNAIEHQSRDWVFSKAAERKESSAPGKPIAGTRLESRHFTLTPAPSWRSRCS
jgi:hypothetical protein